MPKFRSPKILDRMEVGRSSKSRAQSPSKMKLKQKTNAKNTGFVAQNINKFTLLHQKPCDLELGTTLIRGAFMW